MTSFLFTNGRVLDPAKAALIDGQHVLVEDGDIRDVSDTPIRSNAEVIDLRGKTLMPGLIDCHVHVIAGLVNLGANAMLPSSLAALRAARIMEAMLQRGFTTVRDLGGADLGLVAGGRGRADRRPAADHLRQGAVADRRPWRLPPPRRRPRRRFLTTAPVRCRGWSTASMPLRRACARGDQGRRAVHQADGEWRRRLAQRPDPRARLLGRRDRRRRSRRRTMPASTSRPTSTPTAPSPAPSTAASIRSSTAT